MKQIVFIIFFIMFSFTISIAQTISTNKDASTYCLGDSVMFSNSSTVNYESSHWRFGDDFDTWREHPTHIYQTTGSYTVWLILTFSDTSKDSTSIDVTINPQPGVTLADDIIFQSLTANTTGDGITFSWYFNSEITAETDNIIYYLESGLYTVVALNENNCTDSVSRAISLNEPISEDSLSIIVKNNILTPDNADGANDVLFISNLSYYSADVSVVIFNKWGQKVYLNEIYSNLGGFEGKSNSGKVLDAGTYYYVIKSEGKKTTTGYIDLLR